MALPDPDAAWRLRRGVHAVSLGAELVFLDIEADRYLCLPAADVILDPDGRVLHLHDAALGRELQEAALVLQPDAPREAFEPWPTMPPRPTVSALRDVYPGPCLADAAPLGRAVMEVLMNYRGRRFSEILRLVRSSRPSSGASNPQALQSTADAFHRWSPYAPISAKCLLRSFVLLRLLHREGLDAQWVFGVATWPFRAHCWLQAGELALDERLDRIAAFTPILAV
jgi:hypothetical protein